MHDDADVTDVREDPLCEEERAVGAGRCRPPDSLHQPHGASWVQGATGSSTSRRALPSDPRLSSQRLPQELSHRTR